MAARWRTDAVELPSDCLMRVARHGCWSRLLCSHCSWLQRWPRLASPRQFAARRAAAADKPSGARTREIGVRAWREDGGRLAEGCAEGGKRGRGRRGRVRRRAAPRRLLIARRARCARRAHPAAVQRSRRSRARRRLIAAFVPLQRAPHEERRRRVARRRPARARQRTPELFRTRARGHGRAGKRGGRSRGRLSSGGDSRAAASVGRRGAALSSGHSRRPLPRGFALCRSPLLPERPWRAVPAASTAVRRRSRERRAERARARNARNAPDSSDARARAAPARAREGAQRARARARAPPAEDGRVRGGAHQRGMRQLGRRRQHHRRRQPRADETGRGRRAGPPALRLHQRDSAARTGGGLAGQMSGEQSGSTRAP